MTANLDVLGDRVTGVLTAPVEALFKRDDKEVVYVKKPGRRKSRVPRFSLQRVRGGEGREPKRRPKREGSLEGEVRASRGRDGVSRASTRRRS